MKKHTCDKMDINWNKNPTPSDKGIEWHGTCMKCKKKVFEVYKQTDELYDSDTEDIIN